MPTACGWFVLVFYLNKNSFFLSFVVVVDNNHKSKKATAGLSIAKGKSGSSVSEFVTDLLIVGC